MNGYSTEDRQMCSQINNNSHGDQCYQEDKTGECDMECLKGRRGTSDGVVRQGYSSIHS